MRLRFLEPQRPGKIMITFDTLSPAQARWLSMIEYYFPEIHASGKITHDQLKEARAKFDELRTVDKKYKIGWPIWLIMNNSISRGVYILPKAFSVDEWRAICEDDPVVSTKPLKSEYSDEYEAELRAFGIS